MLNALMSVNVVCKLCKLLIPYIISKIVIILLLVVTNTNCVLYCMIEYWRPQKSILKLLKKWSLLLCTPHALGVFRKSHFFPIFFPSFNHASAWFNYITTCPLLDYSSVVLAVIGYFCTWVALPHGNMVVLYIAD